jgi:hypothetical protein
VLEAIRRDTADLTRALADAGVRTDGQSFRFDRGGQGDAGRGDSPWERFQNRDPNGSDASTGAGEILADPRTRTINRNGRIDLMA